MLKRRVLPRRFWESKADGYLEEWDSGHDKCTPGSRKFHRLNAKAEMAFQFY